MKQRQHFHKLRKILLLALLIIPISFVFSQSKTVTRLGIMNPTPGILSNALNLISKQYITADSLEVVGIYHESQASSIAATNKFIEEKGYDHISFQIVEGDLLLENLFEENNCTTQFKKLFDNTDALIFFGGMDIPPRIYSEETFLTTEHFDAGKNWELSFLFHLIGGSQNDLQPLLVNKPDYTILGICLGMQEMNVASGGSMVQDIPYQIYGKTTYESILKQDSTAVHKNYHNRIDNENSFTSIHFHPISIAPGSFLDFAENSENLVVASVHHQAVKDLGKSFKVVATSVDEKVVEALQHIQFPNVYGIQFHTDFSSLYEEGYKFKVSQNKIMELSEETRTFQQLFWQNFSERLK
ncbi:MAG: gamma-glutamyl-gamma-aminobutyrate hydrolase family protein [Dysgonamonadaceae bacterium]|nr:gamma-glutamyl-gamma-aminobutyrate hydrolase family protein [Dysgonamonadaceae bacterium]